MDELVREKTPKEMIRGELEFEGGSVCGFDHRTFLMRI